ncbi:Endopolyphosphatase [Cryptotrichosporon argae]
MRGQTLLVVLGLAAIAHVHGAQAPFSARKKRELKGRFLHITDFHPDPHYVTGGTFDSGCHRKPDKDDKGKGRVGDVDGLEDEDDGADLGKDGTAGRWGSAVSDCDSPMSLVNHTFDWLKKEWADEVDFVVWTGDNARHDIDRSLPRTPAEIFALNTMMVDKMLGTFGKDVPIVPSVGNNDIWPHNVLGRGPNAVTEGFLRIWKHFIPDDDRHVFERGAYYSTEVIPGRLAVISLNTLFWYDSNTLVDGCQSNTHDPGALHMDWLEVQLQDFHDRGMQVWLTGHVPPHLGVYYDNCYLRYGDLALRFQDTIVGHLFGHMNIDHFFFIDVQELEATGDKLRLQRQTSGQRGYVDGLAANVSVQDVAFFGPELRHGAHLANSGRYGALGRSGAQDLVQALKKDFGEMPGPQKLKLKDYAVMNVAPSVIPTYLPGVRIYSYNISGVGDDGGDDLDAAGLDELKKKRNRGHRHDKPKDDCALPGNADKPHCEFRHKPRYYNKTSPSRHNRALSPLGYAQFYLPALDKQSRTPPAWQVEYTTYKLKALVPSNLTGEHGAQPLPVPPHLLPGFEPGVFGDAAAGDWAWLDEAEAEDEGEGADADVDADDGCNDGTVARKDKLKKELRRITPWHMNDLTIPSYVHLARKLVAEKKLWSKFQEYMFVSSAN